jgi:hypothetical protein
MARRAGQSTIWNARIVSRRQTAQAQHNAHTTRMPFREPNINAARNLRWSFCEPRGIGFAALMGYNLG